MYISLISLPLIFIAAPFIMRVVCGGDYPEAIATLRLLIISVFFVSANAFRVQFLLVCGRTRTYSRIHIIMALIGLPLLAPEFITFLSGSGYGDGTDRSGDMHHHLRHGGKITEEILF